MIKLSPQREIFAQEIIKGNTQADAYRVAFPSSLKWPERTLYSKASDLMTDGKVKERIKELQEPVMKKLNITQEKLINELEMIKQLALSEEKKDLNNYIKAVVEQGKLAQLYLDKKLIENLNPTTVINTTLSKEDKQEITELIKKGIE